MKFVRHAVSLPQSRPEPFFFNVIYWPHNTQYCNIHSTAIYTVLRYTYRLKLIVHICTYMYWCCSKRGLCVLHAHWNPHTLPWYTYRYMTQYAYCILAQTDVLAAVDECIVRGVAYWIPSPCPGRDSYHTHTQLVPEACRREKSNFCFWQQEQQELTENFMLAIEKRIYWSLIFTRKGEISVEHHKIQMKYSEAKQEL